MHSDTGVDLSDIEYIFLDRDGVLNRKPPLGQYVTCLRELELLPGAAEAVAAMNRSGRKVIVVTNQRGIALGLFSLLDLETIHEYLRAQLAAADAHLDGIYVCPHDEGQCNCRKPLTGLFEQAFADFPTARPGNSLVAGDSLRDVEAGARLGMRTVFVDSKGNTASGDVQRASKLAQLCVGSLAGLARLLCR